VTSSIEPPRILEARDVSLSFTHGHGGATARAVDGVSLSLAPGRTLALVGESGCGKSTLARILLGLITPDNGQVRLRDTPIDYSTASLKEMRRQVQLVLQDPLGSLNPRHTVYAAVAEGLRIHGGADDESRRVHDALASAGLRPPETFYRRYPRQLSGGQRQRVVIAGALVLQPQVLIADEPVSSLDASVRGEILSLLVSLRQERQLALLLVTHDLGAAWSIADDIAVMYLGRIVETGPTEVVVREPKHPYTRALLAVARASRRIPAELLPGEPPDPTRIPSGCRFHPRCPLLSSGEIDGTPCKEEDPRLRAISVQHSVACHYPE